MSDELPAGRAPTKAQERVLERLAGGGTLMYGTFGKSSPRLLYQGSIRLIPRNTIEAMDRRGWLVCVPGKVHQQGPMYELTAAGRAALRAAAGASEGEGA